MTFPYTENQVNRPDQEKPLSDNSQADGNLSSIEHRLRKVLHFIDQHLDGDLSIEALSAVVHLSPFHFHRLFASRFDISVFRYVQLCRFKSASYRLAYRSQDQVIDIALDHGYDEPESFARAFKRHLGQSPSAFRHAPHWQNWYDFQQPLKNLRNQHMRSTPQEIANTEIRCIDFGETAIAAFEHRGDPALIGQSIRQFIEWRRAQKLSPQSYATFNILYDHPELVAAKDFRFDIATAIGGRDQHELQQSLVNGLVLKTIPAGRCAVMRHYGSDDNLELSIRRLYEEWLPQSGVELRDFPLLLQRRNFFPEVNEAALETDIFLPIQ